MLTDTQLTVGFIILLAVLAVLAYRQLVREGAISPLPLQNIQHIIHTAYEHRPRRKRKPYTRPTLTLVQQCDGCGQFYSDKTKDRHRHEEDDVKQEIEGKCSVEGCTEYAFGRDRGGRQKCVTHASAKPVVAVLHEETNEDDDDDA